MLITLPSSDFLLSYPFQETATFSRSFEGHPTIDGLTYYTKTYPTHIKGEEIIALGMEFFISTMQVTQLVGGRGFKVELELEGGLAPRDSEIVSKRHELDTPVFIEPYVSSSGMLDIGDLISGFATGQIILKVGQVENDDTRVPRELLENAITGRSYPNKFLFYGGNSNIELRDWGLTTTHTVDPQFTENELVVFDEPGQGATVDGVQLVRELVNAVWQPDDEAVEDYDLTRTYVEDPDNAATITGAEYNTDDFKEGKGFFDTGGLVKERRTITETNGKKTSVRVEKYGFMGSTLDLYNLDLSTNSYYFVTFWIASLWNRFEDTTTTYTYNAEGYLTKIERIGTVKLRWKQDEDLEAVKLTLEGAPSSVIDLYTVFVDNDINAGDDVTTYTLTPFRNYYRDYSLDDETKFCSVEHRKINTVISTIDPEAEVTPGEDPPELVSGERYEKKVETFIKLPQNRTQPLRKEEYSVVKTEWKAQNEGLGDRLRIAEESENEGRPGEHDKLILTGNTNAPLDLEDDGTILLNTPDTGMGTSDPVGESLSFDGVYTRSEMEDCAEFLVDIENTKGCRTCEISVIPSLNYEEGDLVDCLDDTWVLLDYSAPLTFLEDGVHLRELASMSLGKLMDVPVTSTIKT